MAYLLHKKRIRRFNKTRELNFPKIRVMKDWLREGGTFVYRGWTFTARDKFLRCHDGRIWITARKGKEKDSDDTLSYLIGRINYKEDRL